MGILGSGLYKQGGKHGGRSSHTSLQESRVVFPHLHRPGHGSPGNSHDHHGNRAQDGPFPGPAPAHSHLLVEYTPGGSASSNVHVGGVHRGVHRCAHHHLQKDPGALHRPCICASGRPGTGGDLESLRVPVPGDRVSGGFSHLCHPGRPADGLPFRPDQGHGKLQAGRGGRHGRNRVLLYRGFCSQLFRDPGASNREQFRVRHPVQLWGGDHRGAQPGHRL